MSPLNKETEYTEAKEILERVSEMKNLYGACALVCLKNEANQFMRDFVLELYDNIRISGMKPFDQQLVEDIVKFGEKNSGLVKK